MEKQPRSVIGAREGENSHGGQISRIRALKDAPACHRHRCPRSIPCEVPVVKLSCLTVEILGKVAKAFFVGDPLRESRKKFCRFSKYNRAQLYNRQQGIKIHARGRKRPLDKRKKSCYNSATPKGWIFPKLDRKNKISAKRCKR